MEYRRCKVKGEVRTGDYIGTVTSKDDPMLLAIKADMRDRNKIARKWRRNSYKRTGKHYDAVRIERIQLMARGPRTKHALDDYGSRRAYDQNLPHRYATHFDVYKRPDTNAEYHDRVMIENDWTPGQYAKLRKLEHMLWEMKSDIYSAAARMGLSIAFDKHNNIVIRK